VGFATSIGESMLRCMEPVGSHFAVLLYDAQLRRGLTPDEAPRPAMTSQPSVRARLNRIVEVLGNVIGGLREPTIVSRGRIHWHGGGAAV
jgi:hypothetical protein